eukprot:TRINITY_DN61814_c0_g1_i5.p1 TRINITY_DN61814_c0_g1~~TRINITY_DN61814_c0_g1_i5.p1  ORF type:complete len:392 (+),score=130.17 TRINITY_DN61814_c0_g1_i5:229-1404(+)
MPNCPVCRAKHRRECGQRVFVEAVCPICLQQGSPFATLPCGHGLCDECLASVGGVVRPAASRSRSRSRSPVRVNLQVDRGVAGLRGAGAPRAGAPFFFEDDDEDPLAEVVLGGGDDEDDDWGILDEDPRIAALQEADGEFEFPDADEALLEAPDFDWEADSDDLPLADLENPPMADPIDDLVFDELDALGETFAEADPFDAWSSEEDGDAGFVGLDEGPFHPPDDDVEDLDAEHDLGALSDDDGFSDAFEAHLEEEAVRAEAALAFDQQVQDEEELAFADYDARLQDDEDRAYVAFEDHLADQDAHYDLLEEEAAYEAQEAVFRAQQQAFAVGLGFDETLEQLPQPGFGAALMPAVLADPAFAGQFQHVVGMFANAFRDNLDEDAVAGMAW